MLKFVVFLGMCGLLSAQMPDYQGPSILSRGGPASSMGRNPDISFRPYVGLNAVYDDSFAAVTTDASGHVRTRDSVGIQGSAGIYGVHHFRHSDIGVSYDGNYYHFPNNHFADGIDQRLALHFSNQVSRRLTFSLTEVAGTYTRNFLYGTAGGLVDPQFLNLPANDLFDNRVIYGATTGSVVYRLSTRLSLGASASGYLVRRRSSSLFGDTGYSANADAAYRVTRYFTIGAAYSFQHFEFTKAFGTSDVHMVDIVLSHRLSRRVELALEGGGARVETLFFAQIPIDPAIAAITGQTTGIIAAYKVRYVPSGRIRLTKQMQHATAELSYGRMISPGNGIYLTSLSEGASATFTYTGLHHWNVGGNLNYTRLGALAQSIGDYEGYQAGAGVTRDLGHGMHFSFRGDAIRQVTNYAGYHRTPFSLTAGFYWSPGEVPLSLW